MNNTHRLLAMATVLALTLPIVLAANNPGHDTLYVLKIGDNITGSLNLTGNLTAFGLQTATLVYGNQLDIWANGTQQTPSKPTVQSAGNNLYLDSSAGDVRIATLAGTTNYVRVGTGSINVILNGTVNSVSNLSVNGTIRIYDNGTGAFAAGTSVAGSPVCTSTNGLCTGGATGYTQWRFDTNTGNPQAITNNTLVNFTAGSGITISHSGTTITIASTGGSGLSTINSPNNSIIIVQNTTLANITVNNTFIWNFVNASFNYSAAIGDLRTANTTLNTTATNLQTAVNNLQTANTTTNTSLTNLFTNVSNHQTAINNLQTANTTTNTSITAIINNQYATQNSTVARTGTANCGVGTVAQNVTTSTSGVTTQCAALPTATGTITGSGATGNISMFTVNGTNIGASNIYYNGGNISIGTTTPNATFDVGGQFRTGNGLTVVSSGYATVLGNGASLNVLAIKGANALIDVYNNSDTQVFRLLDSGAMTVVKSVTVGGNAAFTGATMKLVGYASDSTADSNLEIGDGLGTVYLRILRDSSNNFQIRTGSPANGDLSILPKGNVGIGTAGPTAMLTVNSSSVNGSLLIQNTTGSTHLFVNGSSGYVGIGATSPSKRLEVSNGSQAITFDPAAATPTINTTAGNLTIDSASGYVIISIG